MAIQLFNGRRNVRASGWLCAGLALLGVALLAGSGCDTTKTGGTAAPAPIFSQALGGGESERWTIRCLHSEAPGHTEQLYQLAEMLKKTAGLNPQSVRLATDAKGSTIYYGEYLKTASPQTGRLVFPPEYQRDIQFIRRLSIGQRTPFFYAEPELLSRPGSKVSGDWDIHGAKGAYTLQIAVFYNTAGFFQREQAAADYVRLLRERGYSAYFYHDQNRGISYVYVGDFDASDVITEKNVQRYGPRVEQFIRGNEAEFRNMSENGQIVRRTQLDGKVAAPLSYLVPVPRGGTVPGAAPGQNPSGANPTAGPARPLTVP